MHSTAYITTENGEPIVVSVGPRAVARVPAEPADAPAARIAAALDAIGYELAGGFEMVTDHTTLAPVRRCLCKSETLGGHPRYRLDTALIAAIEPSFTDTELRHYMEHADEVRVR
jgi:hypothetical protein